MEKVKVKGYKAYKHQLEVHKAITNHIRTYKRFTKAFRKTFVVLSRRQAGKTVMVKGELERFAIEIKKSTNFYIAPTFALSKEMFRSIIRHLSKGGLIKRTDSQQLIIELINESIIRCFSAEQGDNIRGFTCTGLMVIDEAYFISDKFYNDVALPFTIAKKAVTLLISTPRFKQGFFYNAYKLGLDTENISYVQSFSFMNHDLSFMLDSEELERIRLSVPRNSYLTEYLGQFIDAESMVFGDFKKCINNNPVEYKKLFIGIDWSAGGNDSTVISILNEKCEQVAVKEWNKVDPVELINDITKYLSGFNKGSIQTLTVEVNSIGSIYSSMLKKQLKTIGVKVYREFVTSNSSKRKEVENLQVAFETGAIKILDDNEQIKQLELYEQTVNENTKTISYNAPKGFGIHDDYVIALMLAHHSYKNQAKLAYSII